MSCCPLTAFPGMTSLQPCFSVFFGIKTLLVSYHDSWCFDDHALLPVPTNATILNAVKSLHKLCHAVDEAAQTCPWPLSSVHAI